MIDANDLVVFEAVASTGSMTAAGERLGIRKQTVSERIRKIEDALGVRLVDRTTRTLALTEAGRALYAHSKVVVARVDLAVDEIASLREEPAGHLRVSLPVSYGRAGLGELLTRLLSRHPRLTIEADLNDRYVDVVGEGYDAVVRVGALADSSLVARRIGQGHVSVVAAPAWLEAHPDLTPEGLADAVCICQRPGETWPINGRSITITPRVVINDLEACARVAIAGVGPARLPTFLVQGAMDRGELVSLYALESPPPLYVVMPSKRLIPGKVRAFVEAVAEQASRDFPLDA